MFCGNCGAKNKDTAKFCTKCGIRLDIFEQEVGYQPEISRPIPEKKKSRIGIVVGVVVVLVALIIALLLVLKNVNEKEQYEDLLSRANRYVEEMDYEKAEAYYLRAIDIKPKEAEAYLELSEMYLAQGRENDAIEILEKAEDKISGREEKSEIQKQLDAIADGGGHGRISENGMSNVHIWIGSKWEHYFDEYSNELLARYNVPTVFLDSCCEKEFDALKKAFENRNSMAMNLETFDQLCKDAKYHKNEMPESFYTYEQIEEMSIRRADTKVVSLLITGYAYYGGVHGTSYYDSENYDTVTGELLLLSDVVTDMKLLPDLIMEAFRESGQVDGLFSETDTKEYIQNAGNELVWTLDSYGISFYFSNYEIASYAAGMQMATISFAEHPELVKEGYQAVPEGFAIRMSSYVPCYIDVDNDGELDEVCVSTRCSTNSYDGEYDQDVIEVNGREYCFDVGINYTQEIVFIHNVDGFNYFYITGDGVSADYTLNIYACENGTIVHKGRKDGTAWYSQYDDSKEMSYEQIITDPSHFTLGTRTDVLCTVSGYKTYSVGSDGMPVSSDMVYYIGNEECVVNRQIEFTVLHDVEGQQMDGISGEKLGSYTIPRGSKVVYFRTDGERFADLKLEDGKIIRVELDSAQWPRTIDEISIEEIFDGVFFAG